MDILFDFFAALNYITSKQYFQQYFKEFFFMKNTDAFKAVLGSLLLGSAIFVNAAPAAKPQPMHVDMVTSSDIEDYHLLYPCAILQLHLYKLCCRA